MSLTIDMHSHSSLRIEQLIDYTWLGGAVAALKVLQIKDPSWKWAHFILDILDTLEMIGDVDEISPDQEPSSGSMLDSLGGYVSIAGEIRSDGLYFPFPREGFGTLQTKLGIAMYHAENRAFIPRSKLDTFLHLVSIQGPLEALIQEELEHD